MTYVRQLRAKSYAAWKLIGIVISCWTTSKLKKKTVQSNVHIGSFPVASLKNAIVWTETGLSSDSFGYFIENVKRPCVCVYQTVCILSTVKLIEACAMCTIRQLLICEEKDNTGKKKQKWKEVRRNRKAYPLMLFHCILQEFRFINSRSWITDCFVRLYGTHTHDSEFLVPKKWP